jgi:phospholipid/cholesterol/gamma-HCH transport system substrate-binding protein
VSRALSGPQAVLLGLTVLLGLALGAGSLFVIGRRGWYGTGAFPVRAAFREIRGVGVGTRVRLKGMDAGEVTAVLPPERPEDPVVLRLLVKGEYRRLLRPDAVVHIENDGLVGGKVLEIRPGPADGGDGPVADDQLLKGDSSDLMADATAAMGGVGQGKGSLGKFTEESTAHDAFVDMMRQGTKTLARSEQAAAALQEDAEALKRLPVLGAYVEDPAVLLQRYNRNRDRRYVPAADLFEPGRAVLTASGKARLDGLAPWLETTRLAGSEVVVVAYADPAAEPQAARVLTRQQSEAVNDYLQNRYGIQKIGWFSSRTVTPVGMGVEPPPLPEPEPLPPGRVEIQVFTP